VEEPEPTTQELRAVQRSREASERLAAEDAPTENAERAHQRRADKAAYLEERLAEKQRSEQEDEG
jgi:hypothetical protein